MQPGAGAARSRQLGGPPQRLWASLACVDKGFFPLLSVSLCWLSRYLLVAGLCHQLVYKPPVPLLGALPALQFREAVGTYVHCLTAAPARRACIPAGCPQALPPLRWEIGTLSESRWPRGSCFRSTGPGADVLGGRLFSGPQGSPPQPANLPLPSQSSEGPCPSGGSGGAEWMSPADLGSLS